MFTGHHANELHFVPIVYVPPKVAVTDLLANGRLLSDEDINDIKTHLSTQVNGRFDKKKLQMLGIKNPKYAIVKDGNRYYAIYRGKEKSLGAGGYGSVKLAQNLITGKWNAIKIMIDSSYKTGARSDNSNATKKIFKLEVQNLKKAGLLISEYERVSHKKTQVQYEMIMELADGVPMSNLTYSHVTQPVIFYLDMGIAALKAFQQLHNEKKMLHRDIKPLNIIYDRINRNATPIDFGFSIPVTTEEFKMEDTRRLGTLDFMAPELLAKGKDSYTYDESTEVYALGKTLADIMGIGLSVELFEQRINDPLARNALKALISSMTTTEPDERITLQQAIAQLENIRNRYYDNHLNVFSRIYNIGYVDIDVFLTASDYERKKMITALTAMDEVQLISEKRITNNIDAELVKLQLESEGLAVHPQLLINPDKKPIRELIDLHASYLDRKKGAIYFPYFINPPPQVGITNNIYKVKDIPLYKQQDTTWHDYRNLMKKTIDPVIVHSEHIVTVVKLLEKQRDALILRDNNDYRITLIQFQLNEIKHSEQKMTYGNLLSDLKSLEKELIEARKPSLGKFLEKYLGIFKSGTTKVVKNSRDVIKKDLGIKK